MSLFTRLYETVQSWRRRRGTVRPRARTIVNLEQLDHRQLLTVNFTGNVFTDFPANQNPGVVYLQDNPAVVHPLIPNSLTAIVKVSGLDINGIRVTYSPNDDQLFIGIQQPDNQKTGQPVLHGDTDNNLDNGTVAPAVLAIEPAFKDFPGLGGSETMGAFLDFTGSGTPDVVAGISNGVGQPKTYQVANAVVNPINPGTIPGFGTELPLNEGNVYDVNDPAHPNFEFSIKNFSQLYLSKTGKTFTKDTVIKVGAFANSGDDDGISEAFFPSQNVNIGNATTPTPVPPVCPPPPPANPPVLVNPHENRHINTAHQTAIRVNVFGTSEFDPTQINPATVRLGGATPYTSFSRYINKDEFKDETFVFNGLDINLPPGITTATVTGQTFAGRQFRSAVTVFNRNDSFYSPQAISARDAKLGRTSATENAANAMAFDVASLSTLPNAAVLAGNLSATPTTDMTAANSVPAVVSTPITVSIPKKNHVHGKVTVTKAAKTPTMAAANFNGAAPQLSATQTAG